MRDSEISTAVINSKGSGFEVVKGIKVSLSPRLLLPATHFANAHHLPH